MAKITEAQAAEALGGLIDELDEGTLPAGIRAKLDQDCPGWDSPEARAGVGRGLPDGTPLFLDIDGTATIDPGWEALAEMAQRRVEAGTDLPVEGSDDPTGWESVFVVAARRIGRTGVSGPDFVELLVAGALCAIDSAVDRIEEGAERERARVTFREVLIEQLSDV